MQGDVLVSDEILGGEAPAKKRGARERLLAVAIVAAGLGAFIVQDTDSTPVTWLIFTGTAPVWVVIVLAAVAGAVLSELGGYLIRRRAVEAGVPLVTDLQLARALIEALRRRRMTDLSVLAWQDYMERNEPRAQ